MLILVLSNFVFASNAYAEDSNSQDIDFTGETISEIKIIGNRLVLDDEILKLTSSVSGSPFSKATTVDDLKNIYGMGFFEKSGVEARPVMTQDGLILEYYVKENLPITGIEIYGNKSISAVDAYDKFLPLVGKPENISLLAESIESLESAYAKNGYILASVKDIDIEEDGTLQVFVDEGYISKLDFRGNKETETAYLQKLVSTVELDEAYNENDLRKSIDKLRATGYFADVSRTITPSDEDNSYILTVDVKEKRNLTIGVGGGVNTRTGLFGNVSASAGNIKGKGHNFNFNGLIGSGLGANNTFDRNTRLFRRSRIIQVDTQYTMPFVKDSKDTLTIFANGLDGFSTLVDLADQTSLGAGVTLARPLDDYSALRGTASINNISFDDERENRYLNFLTGALLEEDGFNVDRFDDNRRQQTCKIAGGRIVNGVCNASPAALDNARGIVRRRRREARRMREDQLEDGAYIQLRPAYVFNNTDDGFRPRHGWKTRANLDHALAHGDIDSFTKLNASVTKYVPVKKDSTFLLNFRTGYELYGNVPQFSQYRLGGISGVRGYRPFTELGIGTELFLTTAEFRTPIYNVVPYLKKYKIMKNVDAAFFLDAGAIGGNTELNDLSERLNQAVSVGFGLRVNLPFLGALRVDIGVPLIEALVSDRRFFRFSFGAADRY